jgi:hypothetical protein
MMQRGLDVGAVAVGPDAMPIAAAASRWSAAVPDWPCAP